jgi:hypothetical protein
VLYPGRLTATSGRACPRGAGNWGGLVVVVFEPESGPGADGAGAEACEGAWGALLF